MSGRSSRRRRGRAAHGRRSGGPGCFSVLLLLVLVVAALGAVSAIFFRIENIDVSGIERYRADEVRTASGMEQGDNLIFFNKFSAISRIFEALPYVEEVKMRRSLPDTLVIEVQETYAAAFVEQGGEYWLLSPKAKLLEKTSLRSEDVIEVRGLELSDPVIGERAQPAGEDTAKVDSLVDVMDALKAAEMLSAVSMISLEGVYDVTFTFLDRFTVELGMPEQLDYKLEFLLEIVDRLGSSEAGTIDMSSLTEDGEVLFRPRS